MAEPTKLKRRIGFWLLTLYGVGVMIGAGIFVLVGAVAGTAGVHAPWAFLLAGLVAAPTAISYAELAVRIPESAGEAAWVAGATGSRRLAQLTGLAIAAVGVISSAAILQGGVGYLRAIWDPGFAPLVVGLLAFLTLAAVIGVLESLALGALFTLIEVAGLVLVMSAGFAAPPVPDGLTLDFPGGAAWSGIFAATLLAFFAFIGFEDMVNMAEETREPERTMPRAILAALGLVTLIYMLVAIAAVRAVAPAELAATGRPLTLVLGASWPGAVPLLAVVAVFATLNGVLAQMVMASRVLYGLAERHGGLPLFALVSRRFGTPVPATLAVAGAILVLALALPLATLAEATAMILLAIFIAMNATLIVLRRKGPVPAGRFRAPFWAPWAGLVLSSATLVLALS